jgi:hypothetical protein
MPTLLLQLINTIKRTNPLKSYSTIKTRLKLIFFLCIPFLILGCKGEKADIPPSKADKPPVVEIAPQSAENAGTKEVIKKITEAPIPAKDNTAPEIISIKLKPRVVYPGTRIKANVEAKDIDDDEVTFSYEWKRNGDFIEGEVLEELDTRGLKKGDLITLYVTPFDGKKKGKTRWSPTRMITNRPPVIISLPPIAISNGKYVYEVKANDPDGDILTFSIEDAPQGMTIDSATGVIQWDIPAATDVELPPTYNIRIVVSDGDAVAFQGFTINQRIEVK